jgi:hypothetical protein
MMSSRICISFSSVAVVIGAVSAPLARPGGQHPDPPDPRPRAALRVEIAAPEYSERLRGDIAALRRSLEDSVLALLDDQFGFVNWRPDGAPPRDTVVVRWVQPNLRPIQVRLEISVRRAEALGASTLGETFEPYSKLSRRRDWRLSSVVPELVARLREIVDAKRQTLVASVLGALPLEAKFAVKLDSLVAHVQVDPASMRVPARSRPGFRVRGTLHGTEETCELILRRCVRSVGSGDYRCSIESVVSLDREGAPGDNAGLLAQLDLTHGTVHLLEYRRMRSAGELVMIPREEP